MILPAIELPAIRNVHRLKTNEREKKKVKKTKKQIITKEDAR